MSPYSPPALTDPDRSLITAEAESAFEEIKRLSYRLQFEVTSGADVDAVHADLRRAIARLRATNAALRPVWKGPVRKGPAVLR